MNQIRTLKEDVFLAEFYTYRCVSVCFQLLTFSIGKKKKVVYSLSHVLHCGNQGRNQLAVLHLNLELWDESLVAKWVEINFLAPLFLSPNPFRLGRANSMVMRWWQMLACLYKPLDPPTHARSSLLPDEEREMLTYWDPEGL